MIVTISFRNQQCITLKKLNLTLKFKTKFKSPFDQDYLVLVNTRVQFLSMMEFFFNCTANFFINVKYQIRCFDVRININQSSDSCSLVFKCLKQICIKHNIHENVLSETHYFPDTSGPHSRKMCKTKKQELSARKQLLHK